MQLTNRRPRTTRSRRSSMRAPIDALEYHLSCPGRPASERFFPVVLARFEREVQRQRGPSSYASTDPSRRMAGRSTAGSRGRSSLSPGGAPLPASIVLPGADLTLDGMVRARRGPRCRCALVQATSRRPPRRPARGRARTRPPARGLKRARQVQLAAPVGVSNRRPPRHRIQGATASQTRSCRRWSGLRSCSARPRSADCRWRSSSPCTAHRCWG